MSNTEQMPANAKHSWSCNQANKPKGRLAGRHLVDHWDWVCGFLRDAMDIF